MVNVMDVITEELNVLNNTGSLNDCFQGTRTGSFFFGPNQELTFERMMPKGQVIDGDVDYEDSSFGAGRIKDKVFRTEIYFFTRKGDIGSNTGNRKDRELMHLYLERIQNALGSAEINKNFTKAHIVGYGKSDRIIYNDTEHVFVGVLPVLWRARE